MKGTSPTRVPLNITTDDWTSAFAEAMAPREKGDTGNRTTSELAKAMGVCSRVVQIRIAKLLEQKRIIVSKEMRPAIDGSLRPVPVYRLKEIK